MMRNSPRSSVTALRDFSIRIGLDASTVTPGSTAPDVSVTRPEMLAALVPCAEARAAGRISNATPTTSDSRCMVPALLDFVFEDAGMTAAPGVARDGPTATWNDREGVMH